MSLHIYRARDQPATSYRDDAMGVNLRVRNPAGRLFWTQCCRRRRPAKNLTVHVYYDCTAYFCATGRGCKDPHFLAAKRRREFRNRSRAAKAAWLRRSDSGAKGEG